MSHCATTFALTLLAAALAAPSGFAGAPPNAGEITVSRATDPAGTAWDVTLPPGIAKTLQDQMWLVVDGKSEGFGGGDFLGDDTAKPLRVYVGVSDERDTEVKDILKAQGFPVKPDVTVYRVTYGLNRPTALNRPLTLHFRHAASLTAFSPLSEAHYKPGDKITLFDAVMLDSSVKMSDVLKEGDLFSPHYKRLPNDQVHRVTIQVQFLPVPAAASAP